MRPWSAFWVLRGGALAGLVARDIDGNLVTDAYYDTDLNVTWLSNANINGRMNWADATAWAGGLTFGTYSGWRLPKGDDCHLTTCVSRTNEMSHLYYSTLGNPDGGPMSNKGGFANLQNGAYWTGKEISAGYSSEFSFLNGDTGHLPRSFLINAMAVRDGDVANGTPTCSPPQVLQNGSCVTPLPALSPAPSLYELSRLSELAYGKAVVQAGWRELSIQPAGFAVGFQAKAVVSNAGDRVVIGFAGSNELTDWLGPNPSFISPLGPTAEMGKFVQDAVEFVRSAHRLHPNASIEFTGHSLGGALAQLMADRLGVAATTFNAPGANGIRSSLLSELGPLEAVRQSLTNGTQGLGAAVVNYRNYGDLVSTFGTQIGSERTFEPIPSSSTFISFKTLVDQFPLTTAKAMHLLDLIQERIISSARSDFERGPTVVRIVAEDTGKGLLSTVPKGMKSNAYEFIIRASVFVIVNYLVDPSDFDEYKVVGAPGSPNFRSFTAPFLILGDYDFALEAEIDGLWRSLGIFGELAACRA